MRGGVWVLFAAIGLGACGDSDQVGEPTLCTAVDPACSPLVEPTYDAVFDMVIRPRCSLPGSGCHGPEAMGTTLVLGDREQGFEQLLGLAGGRSYVAPGSADCSGLMIRLESPARAFQMPPGDPLEPELLCLVFQWIEAGAPR